MHASSTQFKQQRNTICSAVLTPFYSISNHELLLLSKNPSTRKRLYVHIYSDNRSKALLLISGSFRTIIYVNSSFQGIKLTRWCLDERGIELRDKRNLTSISSVKFAIFRFYLGMISGEKSSHLVGRAVVYIFNNEEDNCAFYFNRNSRYKGTRPSCAIIPK